MLRKVKNVNLEMMTISHCEKGRTIGKAQPNASVFGKVKDILKVKSGILFYA